MTPSIQYRVPALVAALVWTEDRARLRAPWRIVVPLIPLVAIVITVGSVVGDRLPVPALILVYQATMAVSVFVLFAAGARYLDRRRSIRDYGLRADRRWGQDLLAGLAIGVVAVTIPSLIGLAAGWFTVADTLVPAQLGLGVGLGLIVVAYLCTGFWEELVFRGVFMSNAADGLHGWLSGRHVVAVVLVLQAIVFGVLHVD